MIKQSQETDETTDEGNKRTQKKQNICVANTCTFPGQVEGAADHLVQTLARSLLLFRSFLFGRAISVFSERFFNRLRPKKNFRILDLQISELRISEYQNLKSHNLEILETSNIQNIRISEFGNYRIWKSQNPRSQNLRFSGSLNIRISESRNHSKISESQNLRI